MICPACSHKNGVTDRICVKCHFLPEAGGTIEVQPPRGGRWAVRKGTGGKRIPLLRLWRLRRVKTNRHLRPGGARWPFLFLVGIMPGLGHLLSRRYVSGVVYGGTVVGLYAIAVGSRGQLAQVCVGLAAGVHAHSMLMLLPPERRSNGFVRIPLMGVLLLVLIVGIYRPLSRQLAWDDPTMQRLMYQNWVGRYQSVELVSSVWLSIVAFVIIAVVAGIVGIAIDAFRGERRQRNG